MNEFEAQLKIVDVVSDVLCSLSEEELTEDDVESMREVADLIVEALALEVKSVSGTTATVTVDLSDPDQ